MGVAAHWAYKERRNQRYRANSRQRWIKPAGAATRVPVARLEIESVKSDLFLPETLRFRREGRIVEPVAGATPVDLLCGAYRYRPCLRGRTRRPPALLVAARLLAVKPLKFTRTGCSPECRVAELCR